MRVRGIALISVLLLLSVLAIMVVALVRLVHGQVFESKAQLDNAAALYAAEAGVAYTLEQLNTQQDWVQGFNGVALPSGRGTYTVEFNTTGPPLEDHQSVNNLASDVAAAGPRGLIVPPQSALLVVEGRVGLASRTLEVLVRRGGLDSIDSPLLASGPIELRGDVSINGLEAFDGASAEVRVHSNFLGAVGEPTISWEPTQLGDRAEVDGQVTTIDPRDVSEAIDFGSDPTHYSVGGTQAGAATVPYPPVDISATIQAHSGDPAPTINPGTTVLGAGDWYLSSDLVLNGDLILSDGAQLYVDGGVDINGAIRGQGSVYVDGDTHFRGDSQVTASNETAVMSKGDIHLEGFDGNQYLEAIPGAAPILSDIERTVDEILTIMDNPAAIDPASGSTQLLGNWQALDNLNHQLGAEPHTGRQYHADIEANRVGALLDLVNAQPASEARDFLQRRLETLHTFTHWQNATQTKEEARDALLDEQSLTVDIGFEGFVDTALALPAAEQQRGLSIVRNLVDTFSYDKLGSSYFQGLLYTNGSVQATNQVTLLGSIVAHSGDPDSGRIVLEGGSHVTFLESFFDDGGTSGGPLGTIQIVTWAGR